MSNFTRSGGRAKIWQSITNLSCCSIDLITKQTRSIKAFAFIVLFAFSLGSVEAQTLDRSTFFNRCMEDAPPGPTEADVANLYLNTCGTTPAEVVKTANMTGTDCDWAVEYTYDVKCGAFEEQIKIGYVGGDRTPPTLNDGAQVPTGADNLNLCFSQAPAGPKVTTIASLYSDNCGDVVVTKTGSPEGDDCSWTANYTYTIQDSCGNAIADLNINYSGGDIQAPQLNKGAEIPTGQTGLNLCFDNKPLGPTEAEIASLFSDNCGTVIVTKTLATEKGNDDCKWLSSFQYTIEDGCGNFATPIFIEYMGGDSEDPVLSGVPADTEVSCIDLIPDPANVTATDNCTDDVRAVLTVNTDNLGPACEGGEIVRTWTATDLCGNTTSASQTIVVAPAPAAQFAPVSPETITCEEASNFVAEDLMYSNGITKSACSIQGSVQGDVTEDFTVCGGTITVNWEFTDECGRSIEAEKVYTVTPAPEATVTGPQLPESISCAEAADYVVANGTYTNGLEGACNISGEIPASVEPVYDACGGKLIITWSGEDQCGRPLSAGPVEIIVDPAPEATVTGPQLPESISCAEAADYVVANGTYTNGLEGACNISGEIPASIEPVYDACGGKLIITWSGEDQCGRPLSAGPVEIIVDPAPAPVFAPVLDEDLACENLADFVPGFLSYSNGTEGPCGINGEVQGVAEPFEGSCGTFKVTYSYESCGVTINASQTITVIDETAPTLNEPGSLPQGMSDVNACFADAPAPPSEEEIEALYSDNCGNVNATLTIVSPQENTDCLWAVLYRYDIQDDCGNFAAPVKIYYNGGDRTAPELVGELPTGVEGLQCLSENPGAPDLAAIQAAYTDNCGDVVITPFEPNITGDDCGWTATYEYEIKDTCGNKLPNLVITNSGADTIAPELEGELPMGENTLNVCKDADLGEPTEEYIASLFSDNCIEITAENVTKTEKISIGSDCEWIRVFEYTVADNCGNTYPTFKVNYAGGDTEGPTKNPECNEPPMVITTEMGADCPADAVIDLVVGDYITPEGLFTVAGLDLSQMQAALPLCFSDNCTAVEDLRYLVVSVDKELTTSCSATLTVEFAAQDLCDNLSADVLTCVFVVSDDTAPVVECPEDVDFGLVTEAPTEFADKATWTDNCQGSGETADYTDFIASSVEQTSGVSQIDLTCSNGSVFQYIQTGFDAEGYATYSGVAFGFPNEVWTLSYRSDVGLYYFTSNFGVFDYFTTTADGFYPSCNTNDIVNLAANCELVIDSCVGSGNTIEYWTLTRTFTANDGCGNIGECSVTYEWAIESQPQFYRNNGTTNEGTSVDCDVLVRNSSDTTIDFKAFPVPFDNEVTISYSFDYRTDVTIELFDTKGLLVSSITNSKYVAGSTGRTKLDVSKTPSQVLYVKLTTSQGTVTKKIVSSGR